MSKQVTVLLYHLHIEKQLIEPTRDNLLLIRLLHRGDLIIPLIVQREMVGHQGTTAGHWGEEEIAIVLGEEDEDRVVEDIDINERVNDCVNSKFPSSNTLSVVDITPMHF